MNPPTFDEAVQAAREQLRSIKGVRAVILFGSVARGTPEEESDIDLLVDCDKSVEEKARRVLYELGDRFDVRFGPVFYRESDRQLFDTQFLESILRSGRALFGKMPALTPIDLDLQALRLVSYQAGRLSPRRRAQLLRAIDGYRTVKRVGRKRYVVEKRGFLGEVGGWRVGRGAVIVPEEAAEAFDSLLLRFGATRMMVPIWCQRP